MSEIQHKRPANMQRITTTLLRRTSRPNHHLLQKQITLRPFSQINRLTMSSDQDYAAFLEKANQDTGSSSEVKTSGFAQTKAVDTAVPAPLNTVDAFYQSDTDEPFEPVALQYGKQGSIDQGMIHRASRLSFKLTSHRKICQPDQPLWRGGKDQPERLECQEPLRRCCRGRQEGRQRQGGRSSLPCCSRQHSLRVLHRHFE